jgi:hypothetical protein
MLIYLNEQATGQALAINPNYIVSVFEAADGDMEGKCIVVLTNGSWVVSQSQLDVVGIVNGALNQN